MARTEKRANRKFTEALVIPTDQSEDQVAGSGVAFSWQVRADTHLWMGTSSTASAAASYHKLRALANQAKAIGVRALA